MTAATAAIGRIIVASLILAAFPSAIEAQGRLEYRTYALGDDLPSVTLRAGLPSPAATDRLQEVGTVQELRWQGRYVRHGAAPAGDPVERLIFSFYEKRLFRIVVDYASDRTAGMTEADMVAALAKIFGTPTRRIESPAAVGSLPRRPVAGVVAEWIVGDQSVALLALQDGTTFRMIFSSALVEVLAVEAGADSVPTDVPDWTSIGASRSRVTRRDEAPLRERVRQANIAAFVP